MLPVDVYLHVLIRLVKFARLALGFQLAHNLLKNLHRLEAAFPLVTFDVHFDAAVRIDRYFKFALRHVVQS